jgi:signal transduction histidine kinase
MCRKIQHYYLDERKDTILIIQSDVTAAYMQQQEETARAKAETKRIENIIDSVATGICVFRMPDADHLEGEFVNLQMFRIIGLTPPDSADARQQMMNDPMVAAYMKDAFIAVHPDDIDRVRQAFHDGFERSNFNAGNYRILKKDGSAVWINQNAILSEVRPDCRVFYATYRVVEHEVELQKLLECQLEKEKLLRIQANTANEAKSAFLSRMSHDIRTPLNGIIGMTHLTQKLELPQKAKENLVKIDTSSKFLLSLINDILDMSKAESGKIELHPEPYSVDEFANYVNSIIAPLCEERRQKFSFEPEEMLTDVVPLIDKLRVNQIVFNLLSNAVKYTPEGGIIRYRVLEKKLDDGRMSMHIDIIDNGIGMSEDFQKVLFDPFTQENRVYSAEMRGTGLGLAITRRLIDAMDGSIAVSSRPGHGTTFSIDFIFDCITAAENGEKAASGSGSEASLTGRHILLCEDHPLNQEIAKAILEEQYALVTIAEDGEAGVKAFHGSGIGYFDCILMDIHMPVMDGYEATRQIRGLNRSDAKTVPIIAMTADAFADDIRKCLDAGMNGHIAKPIEPEVLYSTLRSLVGK